LISDAQRHMSLFFALCTKVCFLQSNLISFWI
jgi:hypothetical protein